MKQITRHDAKHITGGGLFETLTLGTELGGVVLSLGSGFKSDTQNQKIVTKMSQFENQIITLQGKGKI